MDINIRVGIVGIISAAVAVLLGGFFILPSVLSLFPTLEDNRTALEWVAIIIFLILFGPVYYVFFKLSLIFWRKL
ncbi:MAG: hypothetical protein Ta2A_17020 [Treponemataceae bacterium]|nr:MAG: hypothetical protein Ta2A_17020 [Treponemataceae bacterium]